ncbi:hypothetical protein DFH29DRAFT_1073224 [Suillus ampliporus]|nr:hypothetical protein DFH29DRAFT_1073224 [Suillus ampliporus]
MCFRPLLNSLIQTYDYNCSLHQEWTFLLRWRWTNIKGLYIVTRYLPFILLTANLYLSFTPNENPCKCRMLDNMCSGLVIIQVVFSECLSILRTSALWNNNRIFARRHDVHLSRECPCSNFIQISQAFVTASIGVVFANTAPASYTSISGRACSNNPSPPARAYSDTTSRHPDLFPVLNVLTHLALEHQAFCGSESGDNWTAWKMRKERRTVFRVFDSYTVEGGVGA